MRTLFRVDAGLHIGSGHVVRCLTLANALRERGAQTLFVCREHEGHLIDYVREQGHEVASIAKGAWHIEEADAHVPPHAHWLGASWQQDVEQTKLYLNNQKADWLVVDHYALDARWETAMRPQCRKIFAIDDLADRTHDADLLLDQNLGRQPRHYRAYLSRQCQRRIGPRYALLRPEFAHWRRYSLRRRAKPIMRQLLISMGGVDRDNVTSTVLASLRNCPLPADCRIKVVMGPRAPWIADVKSAASCMPVDTQVLINVSNMAELMANSDLAIGAAGSSSWERCCLGLPTISLSLADNQMASMQALGAVGAVIAADRTSVGDVTSQLLLDSELTAVLRKMSRAAACLVDGDGVQQLCSELCEMTG